VTSGAFLPFPEISNPYYDGRMLPTVTSVLPRWLVFFLFAVASTLVVGGVFMMLYPNHIPESTISFHVPCAPPNRLIDAGLLQLLLFSGS
jgi:hypothetical protein